KFGAKKGAKPSRQEDDDDRAGAKKPVYPSRTLLNVLVLFMLLGFIGVFGGLLLFGDQIIQQLEPLGLPKVKGPVPKLAKKRELTDEEKKKNKDDADKLAGAWIIVSAEQKGATLDN